jgi:dihydroorotate dehydrogenase
MYENIIFPIISFLTRKDAELAHRMAIAGMKIAQEIPGVLNYIEWRYGKSEFTKQVTVAGIDFPGRVGLAAGFDKHAEALPFLGALFDFVEVGTVLPYEQEGNKRPRLFRLPQYGALINRMGFNSEGVAAVEERLMRYRPQVNVPVGISLGMHRWRPLELAQHDFIMVLMELYVHGDYFVINIWHRCPLRAP